MEAQRKRLMALLQHLVVLLVLLAALLVLVVREPLPHLVEGLLLLALLVSQVELHLWGEAQRQQPGVQPQEPVP